MRSRKGSLQLGLLAISIDGLAADVLDRDPSPAVLHAGIDEARHCGVLEARQYARFAFETRIFEGGDLTDEQFDSDRLRYPIGALGAINHTHPAHADALD
jgi:hypothetical protein